MTLPEDVLEHLREIDPDPGWAIVKLYERVRPSEHRPPEAAARVEIALLDRRRGLIVVDRRSFRGLPGVALLPLSPTRAFLALEAGSGLADLELAVVDRLEEGGALPDRECLLELRKKLREWRQSPEWRFAGRSIIVAEREPSPDRKRKPDSR